MAHALEGGNWTFQTLVAPLGFTMQLWRDAAWQANLAVTCMQHTAVAVIRATWPKPEAISCDQLIYVHLRYVLYPYPQWVLV